MRTSLIRNTPAAIAAVLLPFVGLGAGCGGGATGAGGSGGSGGHTTSSGTMSTTSSTGTGSSVITCDSQPANLALSGTWAAVGKLSVKLQGAPGGAITICPADQVGEAEILMLITVQQNAADPTKIDQIQANLYSITLPTV